MCDRYFCLIQIISLDIETMNRSSTSPFRGTTAPRQTNLAGNSQESLQLLVRSLERENNGLVQQINVLKQKSKKVNELQDKTQLIVKHNDQLLRQNERLAKLINQKKNQVEVWKNKFDSLTVSRSATSDIENRKLLNEIEKLREDITTIEHSKNMQINDVKNQNHLEIQNLKRLHLSSNEKYELEIRKLKEHCDKKDYEMTDINLKLVRLNKETDFEIAKLRQEKDRLRSDLHYEQTQHKKQIESLKSKFEYNFASEIDNLRKQHMNQIEALDYENTKLKEVINSKNMEIEQIMAKNIKVKNNYEDSIELLKKQNEDLKDKIFETERIAEIELSNLRDKLEGIKESQLSLLKNAHNNQLDLLNRQIGKLQQIIENRNNELDTLAKEKLQIRQSLQAQIVRAQAELNAQINENREQAVKFQKDLNICDFDLKNKNEQMKTIESYLQSQINTLRNQNVKLAELLDRKTESLEKERENHYLTKKTLEAEAQTLQERLTSTKDELERQSKKSGSDQEDLKKINDLKIKQLDSKIAGLEDENAEKDKLIDELRETIRLKQREIVASNQKINHLQSTEKDLRRQLKENLARWQVKQAQYNTLVKTQTEAQEKARKREIQELKNIHENKIKSNKHQIKQLERHIEDKNNVLNKLKSQYEDLVNRFEEVFSQRAAQKNLDIKIPGWIPDTIATKSLFDVFLKTKVLQYCS